MSLKTSLEISASGLTAERLRMDTISNNIANMNVTSPTPGGGYRRKHVVQSAAEGGSSFSAMLGQASGKNVGRGVRIDSIEPDSSPFKMVYDPGHPHADPITKMVEMPNVEPVMEMVDLIAATRSYEAGVTAITAVKQMHQKALEIGKG